MPHLTWERGGTATILSVQDDALTLRSSIPSPPGSRLQGMLQNDERVRLKIKIHSSKREHEGVFFLTGRLLEATRETRTILAHLIEQPTV